MRDLVRLHFKINLRGAGYAYARDKIFIHRSTRDPNACVSEYAG